MNVQTKKSNIEIKKDQEVLRNGKRKTNFLKENDKNSCLNDHI